MTNQKIARTAGLGALGAALMVLSACGGAPAETADDTAAAAPGELPGVAITNARLVLAPVAGNPAAVYFDLAYTGDKAFSIRDAKVEGAQMTMMHDYAEYDRKVQMVDALPVALAKGTTVNFAPGGLHLMAMGVPAAVKPGDTAKVTLTMSGGTTHSFAAEVRAAGEER